MTKLIYQAIACTMFCFSSITVNAQWGAPYTNSWIFYGQPYVKIAVTQKGIHKLPLSSLPSDFPLDQPDRLQLWHHGRQIAILAIDNKEIQFYAVPNDGGSDSLLYRPASSRMNPYWSMYSDESAYFLTVGNANGLRAQKINTSFNKELPLASFHMAKLVKVFKDEYSHSIANYLRASFLNSYFEKGASRTGKISMDGKPINLSFQMEGLVRTSVVKPTLKLMIHGRSVNSRNIEVYIGKNTQSLRKVTSINNEGFGTASDYSFELESGDFDEANNCILSLKAVSSSSVDGYSVAYYSVSYPQSFDMRGKKSYDFSLMPVSEPLTRLSVAGINGNYNVVDVTDIDTPRLIVTSTSDLMIPRPDNRVLNLVVSSEYIDIKKEKVTAVDFSKKYPVESNYIMIASENLFAVASKYADYRRSAEGGSFETLLINVKDLYNQFNYGEPSPIAIRRFIDYMLSSGIKNKYLFLIGKSITFNEVMVRELPNEVPTIGMPGSDLLLVEGLAGAQRDVPALPVGRLSALTEQNVLDYLQKVKDYELNSAGTYGWRKNILHLNGGKTIGEISQLKGILASLAPKVENGPVGGKVTPFVKRQAIGEVETVNITPEVNLGAGLITYFGHGSTIVTDLDMGYVTDVKRGYSNSSKYPVMYFNGCGVGNIFTGRFNASPTATNDNKYALSLDWILAPKKGAIAIIANSYDSFVTPASRYLDNLYNYVFTNTTTANLSIGEIQSLIAKKMISEGASNYDIANLHQSLLQGDPALKVISVPHPDYAIDPNEGIKLLSDAPGSTIKNSDKIKINFYLNNFGRFIQADSIPIEVTFFYKNSNNSVTKLVSGFANLDTLSLEIPNEQNFTRIEVKIDPKGTIPELDTDNNTAELDIDWEVANNFNVYPQGSIDDLIAPILDVQFNGRNITNDEVLSPNPTISVILKDDRFVLADTSKIDLYIKSCGDNTCDFRRINYSSESELVISSTSIRSITLSYVPSNISKQGVYELLVVGRDDSGNVSGDSYRIRFVISDKSETLNVIVSPNPASMYVRFETGIYGELYDSIEWIVYNSNGVIVIKDKIITLVPGINEWYWRTEAMASGQYYYNVSFKSNDNVIKHSSGKMVIAK